MGSLYVNSNGWSPYSRTPSIVAEERRAACRCDCSIDFFDPCASCPQKKWGTFCCETTSPHIETPPIGEMLKSAGSSITKWAGRKFKTTDRKTLETRMEACRSCEFWDAKAIGGTGRCMKCGCSTWAKLRMATEKCPIGKW